MKVPEKVLFWPFWPFLGKKYIACGDKIVFSEIFGLTHIGDADFHNCSASARSPNATSHPTT